jgi:MFS family permease
VIVANRSGARVVGRLAYRAGVLRPYRDLLSTPGALGFSAAGFVARMPIAMLGLGIVLMVSRETGSYGLAGTVSAVFALLNAAGAPLVARLVDRHGQRRVALPGIAVHVGGLGCLIALVEAGAPPWTYFLAAAVAAPTFPSIGSMVRARWTHVLGSTRQLQTAYSLESVVDELVFVTGPPLVTLLSTRAWSGAGLVAAVLLLLGGAAVFFAQRASEPPPHPRSHHTGASALRLPGMPVIVVVAAWLGTIFGAMEVTAVAFADSRGHPAAAGMLLALYAAGSMLGGLVYGVVHWQASLPRRYVVAATGMAVTLLPLPFVGSLVVLAPLAFLAGLAIAPTIIANVGLIERLVPTGRFNEGLAWSFSGLAVGLAAGAAAAGVVADRTDPRWGFAVAALAGVAAALSSAVGYRRLQAATARLPELQPERS